MGGRDTIDQASSMSFWFRNTRKYQPSPSFMYHSPVSGSFRYQRLCGFSHRTRSSGINQIYYMLED